MKHLAEIFKRVFGDKDDSDKKPVSEQEQEIIEEKMAMLDTSGLYKKDSHNELWTIQITNPWARLSCSNDNVVEWNFNECNPTTETNVLSRFVSFVSVEAAQDKTSNDGLLKGSI